MHERSAIEGTEPGGTFVVAARGTGQRRQSQHSLGVKPIAASLVLGQGRVAERGHRRRRWRRRWLRERRRWWWLGKRHLRHGRRGRRLGDGEILWLHERDRHVVAVGHRRPDPGDRASSAEGGWGAGGGWVGTPVFEIRAGLELGRAAQDEPLAGAGHGHVEQPALLVGLDRLPLLAERPVIECGLAPAGAGLGQSQPESPVAADPHQLGAPARTAPQVGDTHHVELEPLGSVDRHQPHRIECLPLDRRLGLARLATAGGAAGGAAGPCPPRDQVEEPPQVSSVGGLVLAGQAHQLADVREPALPARHGQHGQVVPGLVDRALDQRLGAGAGGHLPLDGEPVGEPTE